MTNPTSPDQAMDALVAARPQPESVEQVWYIGRRERVLQQVLTGPVSPVPAAGLERRRSRRWGVIAAAAVLIVTLGSLAQVWLPLGSPGSPQSAQAIDRLAAAVPAGPVIPSGSYELVVHTESGVYQDEHGGRHPYNSTRSTWTAADGWAWAHQTGDDPAWYTFAPFSQNYDLTRVPPVPGLMEVYLRARVHGSTSVEEALFEAVRDTLVVTPTPAETRVAAIRMLANVSGVTVREGVTDPDGRPATEVRFVDEWRRPGIVNAIYLDPATTQLLAQQWTEHGAVLHTSLNLERRIVSALPGEVLDVLGAERVGKSVER